MDSFTHWEKMAKGWIFISHSSKDYESVKIVRNYLEDSGFSALIFYLKSLENPKRRKLTQQLIEWEIEERNIFVLCNSKEAKKSPWVQKEIDYVKSFPEKIYVELDMDRLEYEKCTQLSKLDNLMKRATLFFSYSWEDKEYVMKFYEYLNSKGFRVWLDTQYLRIGSNWHDKIIEVLDEATKNGAILLFISKNYLESAWGIRELQMSLNLRKENNALVLPIIIDDIDISNFPLFANQFYFKITQNEFESKKEELLKALSQVLNRKLKV